MTRHKIIIRGPLPPLQCVPVNRPQFTRHSRFVFEIRTPPRAIKERSSSLSRPSNKGKFVNLTIPFLPHRLQVKDEILDLLLYSGATPVPLEFASHDADRTYRRSAVST